MKTDIKHEAKAGCIKEDFCIRKRTDNTFQKRKTFGDVTVGYQCACPSWKIIYYNYKGNILKNSATLCSCAILLSDFKPNKLDCLNILIVGVQTNVGNAATDSARWSFPSKYIK